MKKITLFFLLLFLGSGVISFFKPEVLALIRYRLNPDYPSAKLTKMESISGLEHEVHVYFDEHGIPHIKAQTPQDLALVVGYIQWRDRGWQMDFLRHFASGRLSELLGRQAAGGTDTVSLDRAMRGWNLAGRLPQEFEQLDPFDQQVISAFLKGMKQAQQNYRPLEYRLLGLEPQPWNWRDLYLVSLTQAWSLSHNWEHELVRLVLSLRLGFELADEIYPLKASSFNPTISPSADAPQFVLPPARARELYQESYFQNINSQIEGKTSSLPDLFQWRPAASNAWVIDGSRSVSGMPMLANDMHLNHSLPSLLYLMHVSLPDREMIGVTLPGLPFPVSGHNSHVAWGITSTVADVMDLVIEKRDPQNSDHVLSEDSICPLVNRVERILIKGEEALEVVLQESCRGFILNSSHPNLFTDTDPLVALQWNVKGIEKTLKPLYDAMAARDVDELKLSIQQLTLPAQNVTAADRFGNISFFTLGKIPLRPHHLGLFPIPGWINRYQSTDYAQVDELPSIKNPKTGVLINANNLTRSPESHPVVVHIDSAPDYRYDRILERLEQKEQWSQMEFASIQLDTKLLRAAKVLPHMLEDLRKLKPKSTQVITLFEEWDQVADLDSKAMGVFANLYRSMIWNALGDRLDNESRRLFLRQRYSTNTVDLWFERDHHPIWKSNEALTELSPRAHAMKRAFEQLSSKIDLNNMNNLEQLRWGHLHRHRPRHVFGRQKFLDFMNLDEIELAGSIDSVWKVHFDMHNEADPFRSVAGAAYRFVVDLAHPEHAQFILDTGQSGWPLSPNYADQYKLWSQGKMLTPAFPWRSIKSDQVLILKP
jgi:penicillin G amidase